MARIYNNTNKLLSNLDASVKACMLEIGTTGRADLMANCVVGKNTPAPGTLRKGHFFRLSDGFSWSGGFRTKKVIFANYVEYAPYVEFKRQSKGGRPWFRMTLKADTEKFNNILKKHIAKGMKL